MRSRFYCGQYEDLHVKLLSDLKKAKRGAIARTLTMIENDPVKRREILKAIFADSGGSVTVGITGPAGAGKSSLINKTAEELQGRGLNPAVLAIDPSSHISGGAILGDRVRMTESTDSGLYIRSMASRGAAGAVSGSLRNSVRVLEYAGFDPVIIESVGAGQTEVEIASIADVTVVVFSPHTGDSIQAIKAGLSEIGDIYLINKSDISGSSKLFDTVREFIGGMARCPVVLKTSARRGTGISQFTQHLEDLIRTKRDLKQSTEGQRLELEMRNIILNNLKERLSSMIGTDRATAKCVEMLKSKEIDPYEAAERIVKKMVR